MSIVNELRQVNFSYTQIIFLICSPFVIASCSNSHDISNSTKSIVGIIEPIVSSSEKAFRISYCDTLDGCYSLQDMNKSYIVQTNLAEKDLGYPYDCSVKLCQFNLSIGKGIHEYANELVVTKINSFKVVVR